MTENDPNAEERVEDLDVPESESEDVKGGLNYSKIEYGSFKFQKIQPGGKKLNPGGAQLGDGSV